MSLSLDNQSVQVYFCHCKYLYELMKTFSVCNYDNSKPYHKLRKVKWTDNGLKITLCEYYKIGEFENIADSINILKKWDGNQVTKSIGRSVLRIGDIFKYKEEYYLYVCKRLIKIPETISNRLIIFESD